MALLGPAWLHVSDSVSYEAHPRQYPPNRLAADFLAGFRMEPGGQRGLSERRILVEPVVEQPFAVFIYDAIGTATVRLGSERLAAAIPRDEALDRGDAHCEALSHGPMRGGAGGIYDPTSKVEREWSRHRWCQPG
jgi:hypothetical protein